MADLVTETMADDLIERELDQEIENLRSQGMLYASSMHNQSKKMQ